MLRRRGPRLVGARSLRRRGPLRPHLGEHQGQGPRRGRARRARRPAPDEADAKRPAILARLQRRPLRCQAGELLAHGPARNPVRRCVEAVRFWQRGLAVGRQATCHELQLHPVLHAAGGLRQAGHDMLRRSLVDRRGALRGPRRPQPLPRPRRREGRDRAQDLGRGLLPGAARLAEALERRPRPHRAPPGRRGAGAIAMRRGPGPPLARPGGPARLLERANLHIQPALLDAHRLHEGDAGRFFVVRASAFVAAGALRQFGHVAEVDLRDVRAPHPRL
mmetsp:Transcript_32316/g.94526  ORF Transcript_32316/g.94526 Transcript_32316/m.94526 type:complete len:277 (+) Transcript_32316:381-1211(+)